LRSQIIAPARILPDRGAAAGTGVSPVDLPIGTKLARRFGTKALFVCDGLDGVSSAPTSQVYQPETLFGSPPHWHRYCFDVVQTENGLAAPSSMIR